MDIEQSVPKNYKKCADENGVCKFSDGRPKVLYYGGDNKYTTTSISPNRNTFECNNSSFNNNDPAPNIAKSCYVPSDSFYDRPTSKPVCDVIRQNYNSDGKNMENYQFQCEMPQNNFMPSTPMNNQMPSTPMNNQMRSTNEHFINMRKRNGCSKENLAMVILVLIILYFLLKNNGIKLFD
jgi:hypothetical protein